MRLQIHRRHFGVDPDGQWWQNVQGDWVAIPKPAWANKKKKQEKVVNLDELRMKPPEDRKDKIQLVTVYKVSVKTVPDYEAEVLCRNGWTTEAPIFACRIDESAGMEQLTLDSA